MMKTFHISLLGTDAFDVTVSATLPDGAARAVRGFVRDAALSTDSPSARAAMLMWRLTNLAVIHGCTGKLEISNKPDYSGYVITINLEGNHLHAEDFANNGNNQTVDFSELAGWVDGSGYDGYEICAGCGADVRYCSCDD
jgi:hypothetical protein